MKKDYGSFLKMHRIKSGYKSARKFAEACSVSGPTITRIEANVQKPEASTLRKISPYLITTSLKELLVFYDYISESDYMGESKRLEFTDVCGLINVQGQPLSDFEIKATLAYIQTLRSIDNHGRN